MGFWLSLWKALFGVSEDQAPTVVEDKANTSPTEGEVTGTIKYANAVWSGTDSYPSVVVLNGDIEPSAKFTALDVLPTAPVESPLTPEMLAPAKGKKPRKKKVAEPAPELCECKEKPVTACDCPPVEEKSKKKVAKKSKKDAKIEAPVVIEGAPIALDYGDKPKKKRKGK